MSLFSFQNLESWKEFHIFVAKYNINEYNGKPSKNRPSGAVWLSCHIS